MEKWKGGQQRVVPAQVQHLAKLADIAKQVAVTEHHAFRFARGPAGEENDSFLMVAHGGNAQCRCKNPPRRDRNQRPPEADPALERLHDLLDKMHVRRQRELGKLHQNRRRGDDVAQFRNAQRGLLSRASGGKIQVHRHLAGEHHGKVGDHRRTPRRQKDGDPPGRTIPQQVAGKGDGCGEQHAPRHRRVVHPVDQHWIELPVLEPPQARHGQVTAQQRALLKGSLPQFQQPLPHACHARAVGRERLAEGDADRIGNPLRPFLEIFVALKRKNGSPELVEPDRHDGSVRVPRDDFVSPAQPQKDAASGEFALRENADDLSRPNALGSLLHGLLGAMGGDGDRLHQTEERVQQRVPIDRLVHQKPDRAGTGGLQENGVYPGDVIGQQKAPSRRKVFEAGDPYPIHGADQQFGHSEQEALARHTRTDTRSGRFRREELHLIRDFIHAFCF